MPDGPPPIQLDYEPPPARPPGRVGGRVLLVLNWGAFAGSLAALPMVQHVWSCGQTQCGQLANAMFAGVVIGFVLAALGGAAAGWLRGGGDRHVASRRLLAWLVTPLVLMGTVLATTVAAILFRPAG